MSSEALEARATDAARQRLVRRPSQVQRCANQLVVSDARAPLCHMPQHPAGIEEVRDSKSPRLNCGSFRRLNSESRWKIQSEDVGPPLVEIVDHQLHHAVVGPIGVIARLRNESPGACTEDRHITSLQEFPEAHCLIELLG